MIFASGIFLFWFLPALLLVYYGSPRAVRSLVIAGASYIFYGWWRPDFVALMLISTVVDYWCGRSIAAARDRQRPCRSWLLLSVCVNLGLLGYFKYANFGVDTLNALLAGMGMEAVGWTKVVLPIGISFYTFQTMSYTIDVYRGAAPPVGRFRDFMCYVAMFPQLVAGPIVRYRDVADQLRDRTHSWSRFYQGALLFECGLAKKLLIADVLDPVASLAFDGAAPGMLGAWTGLGAFTLQIYFDFSGYSDMAIGLGLMLGFRLPVNFDAPYRSRSITEFWRRWHISLSSWLRDYLYVPLGGNRRGPIRTYVNLGVTMLLGGLWHGANWTFMAWGAWQAAWLIVERLGGREAVWRRAPGVLRQAACFLVVMLGWVWFRSADLGAAMDYFGALAGAGAGGPVPIAPIHVVALVAGVVITFALPTSQQLAARDRLLWVIGVQLAFFIAILQLHAEDHVPFLYFQF